MKFRLECEIILPNTETIHKEYFYEAETKAGAIEQIDTLPFHRYNLRLFGRTAFKDIHGIKHKWRIKPVKDEDDLQH